MGGYGARPRALPRDSHLCRRRKKEGITYISISSSPAIAKSQTKHDVESQYRENFTLKHRLNILKYVLCNNSYLGGVAAECCNVVSHPSEGEALVLDARVSGGVGGGVAGP